MKFNVNDIVILVENKKYNNGDEIKAGSIGRILTVYVFSGSYLVSFEGAKMSHRLLETSLRKRN